MRNATSRINMAFFVALQLVFDNLVDVTEPIRQAIDSAKAEMTMFGFKITNESSVFRNYL